MLNCVFTDQNVKGCDYSLVLLKPRLQRWWFHEFILRYRTLCLEFLGSTMNCLEQHAVCAECPGSMIDWKCAFLMIGLTSSFKMMVVSQRCAHMYFMCMHLVRAASYLHASLFVVHATYYNRLLVTNIIPSSNHTSGRRLGVHSTDCSYQFQVGGNLFLSCTQVCWVTVISGRVRQTLSYPCHLL